MAASPALARLDAFVGTWQTEGEMRGDGSSALVRFTATDAYEWLPGGHFLLHRFDAAMPDGRVQGIEVVGHDPETGAYPMHSFDSTGSASVMQARVDGDAWTFTGERLRFAGGFRDGGRTFAGTWELHDGDGADWRPLMDVRLRKAEAAEGGAGPR